MISFGADAPEALTRLTEVLERLSSFGLQLKAKKCKYMQTEVAFLGHIVGRNGLACDPEKLSAVRVWHFRLYLRGGAQFTLRTDHCSLPRGFRSFATATVCWHVGTRSVLGYNGISTGV